MFISEMFLDARRIKFMFITTFVQVPHRKTDTVFITKSTFKLMNYSLLVNYSWLLFCDGWRENTVLLFICLLIC